MIELTRAARWDVPGLYLLYRSAFPPSERKPFGIILRMAKEGRTDLWVIRRNGKIAGMAATVNGPEVVLLDYFAVKKSLRGKGIGSAALRELEQKYADRGLFVEIESTQENAPNQQERESRKRFYEGCGMVPMGLEVMLFGIRMELLGIRCKLSFDEYRDFYVEYYTPRAAKHIHPVEEKQ